MSNETHVPARLTVGNSIKAFTWLMENKESNSKKTVATISKELVTFLGMKEGSQIDGTIREVMREHNLPYLSRAERTGSSTNSQIVYTHIESLARAILYIYEILEEQPNGVNLEKLARREFIPRKAQGIIKGLQNDSK